MISLTKITTQVFIGMFLFLLTACSTSKNAQKTAASEFNIFQQMCSCQNSKGETIESFAQKEKKELGISEEDYRKYLVKKGNEWVFQAFFKDETFKKGLEKIRNQVKENPPNAEGEFDEWMKEVEQTHPLCAEILPFFLMNTLHF